MSISLKHIHVIKSGKVLEAWPCSDYQVQALSGIVSIQRKDTRETVAWLSPSFYDTVEIYEEEDVSCI